MRSEEAMGHELRALSRGGCRRQYATIQPSRTRWAGWVVLLVPMLLTACDTVPAAKYLEVTREAQASKEKVRQLEDQLGDEQKSIRNLQERLAHSRGMDFDEMKALAAPVRISLESPSGAYDTDGKPGDDGIVLYIQPIDSDGDVIKAAGSIGVTLLDLTKPAEPKVIATYDYDVPTTHKMWYGRLLTNHYTVRCPWPPGGSPATDKVTAVVEFKDLLTGRVLTAQEAFEVKRPPTLPASHPS